jgi:hypothetical protein
MRRARGRAAWPPDAGAASWLWAIALAVWLMAVWSSAGCGVRAVTTCVTYDRALQRPDPNTLIQRDSAGASVCVETGPRE